MSASFVPQVSKESPEYCLEVRKQALRASPTRRERGRSPGHLCSHFAGNSVLPRKQHHRQRAVLWRAWVRDGCRCLCLAYFGRGLTRPSGTASSRPAWGWLERQGYAKAWCVHKPRVFLGGGRGFCEPWSLWFRTCTYRPWHAYTCVCSLSGISFSLTGSCECASTSETCSQGRSHAHVCARMHLRTHPTRVSAITAHAHCCVCRSAYLESARHSSRAQGHFLLGHHRHQEEPQRPGGGAVRLLCIGGVPRKLSCLTISGDCSGGCAIFLWAAHWRRCLVVGSVCSGGHANVHGQRSARAFSGCRCLPSWTCVFSWTQKHVWIGASRMAVTAAVDRQKPCLSLVLHRNKGHIWP